MKKTLVALTATIAALSACSSPATAEPDISACEQAMTEQFEEAMAAGEAAEEGSRPAACEGIDDATLQQIAGEIMTHQMEEAFG